MLCCGVSEKNITPEPGMSIPGYFECRKVSGIIDELFTKAIVLENHGVAYAVIVCDTINLERQDVLRIRKEIAEKLPIPEENISVSATHTHTGGPTWEGFGVIFRDQAYISKLVDAAADAAAEAYENRKPAKIGFTSEKLEGYSFIRRYWMKDGMVKTNPGVNNPDIVKPEGVPDYTLSIAKIVGLDGRVIAFLTSYGVHLDMVGGNEVCADYPGELSRCIKNEYGNDVVSIFFTGPCGNTNHINVKEPDSLKSGIHIKTGRAIFEKLKETENSIVLKSNPELDIKTKIFLIRFNRPGNEELNWAENVLNGNFKTDSSAGYEISSVEQAKIFANAIIDAHKNNNRVSEVEIKALGIGDAILVAWPGEVFVDYGIALRNAFPDKSIMISELSNGCIQCYIPTREAYDRGGYEPRICCEANPEKETGNLILKNTLDMLN